MIRLALICAVLAAPVMAQDAAEVAFAAARELENAAVQLDHAEDARDRVQALTETVRAYEAGLAAMRDSLRGASIREIELRKTLQARDNEIADLLGVLTAIGPTAGPQQMVHPSGPVGTARTALMVAAVSSGLSDRAAGLRVELEELETLRRLQIEATERLTKGLQGAQEARAALSQAVADRTDLPQRFVADPVRMAILLGAAETMEAFASQLDELSVDQAAVSLPPIGSRKGVLPLPVLGELVRGAGEPDAAGVTRPGIVVAARERALVTSPTAATIRYMGPLLDYGLVVMLEPEPDLLFVIAGLNTAYGEIGQVIPEGSPIGLMGGQSPESGDILSQSGDRAGNQRPETLYIEVRQGGASVDPLDWFTTDKG